jgi:hypothetical protein
LSQSDTAIELSAWLPREQVPGAPAPSEQELLAALESNAAFVASGIALGFSFEWVPPNPARGIEESFALRPLGGLALASASSPRYEGPRAVADFSFILDAESAARRMSFQGILYRPAKGRGSAPRERGNAGWRDSVEDAARAAVEASLRLSEGSRPRSVTGEMAFAAPPLVSIVAGRFVATLEARILVREVQRYVAW